ncbi:MAG: hypothetical protein AAGA93_10350 [Actinomycetota bacterium]
MADEERNPVDDLVDLFVYAPVGLLYEYDEVLPRLVRRGKSQVQLARVIGKMAMRGGGTAPANLFVEAVAKMLAERITEIGASIGLAPPTDDATPGSSPSAPVGSDDVADDDEVEAIDAELADDEPEDEPVAEERPLPIASYDTLTAREIISLLDELDSDQLARIRVHEEANRARKTVLGKLDRLQS